jgi:hypothetical protein
MQNLGCYTTFSTLCIYRKFDVTGKKFRVFFKQLDTAAGPYRCLVASRWCPNLSCLFSLLALSPCLSRPVYEDSEEDNILCIYYR